MGKNQKLELPAPPTYQQNPNLQPGITNQFNLANNLTSGNLPSWLQSTINPNNSANALSQAQNTLQPQFRDTLQQITNEAAANNQLGSSTFTNALAKSQSDLNSQYQAIVSGQAINDSNQANANKLKLFGSGLDTLQQGIGNAQGSDAAENSFNLQNYSNLVAQTIQQNQNANNANGFQQILGLTSPFGHDYLQSQGVNQIPGYSTADTLKMASSLFGGFGGLGSGSNGSTIGQTPGFGGGTSPYSGPTPGFYTNPLTFQSAPFAGAYASNR